MDLRTGTLVLEPVSGTWGNTREERTLPGGGECAREVRVRLHRDEGQPEVSVWYPVAHLRLCGPYAVVMPACWRLPVLAPSQLGLMVELLRYAYTAPLALLEDVPSHEAAQKYHGFRSAVGNLLSSHAETDGESLAEFRELERGLAYEHCASVLDSHCVHYSEAKHIGVWLNLLSAEIDVTDEVKYLQRRGLLDIHPELPGVVSVRDESEELVASEGVVQA